MKYANTYDSTSAVVSIANSSVRNDD